MLKQIYRLGSDGIYHSEIYNVPLQYVWSPSEFSPALQSVKIEEVLDFGFIRKNEVKFFPALYHISGNFRGFVLPNESVRYSLQIVADNYVSSNYYIFEVSWNGEWSDNPNDMKKISLLLR